MKKMILSVAMLLTALQPAFAQPVDLGQNVDFNKTVESDMPLNSEVETLGKIDAGDIAGGIIGGVIGGVIAAEIYERRHRPYPGRPVVCYAENRRGEIFRGRASRARWAQEIALDKCYRFSGRCRPLGCEVDRGYGRGFPRHDRYEDVW